MVNPTSEFPKQLFWPDYKIQLQDWEMFPSSYHYYDFSTSPIWSLFTINSRPNHRSCPLQRLFENCLLFTTGGPRFTHFHFMSFKLYLAFRKVFSYTIRFQSSINSGRKRALFSCSKIELAAC